MSIYRIKYALIIFLLFSAVLSFAESWPPISPEDLKLTTLTEQPGAPAVILLREEVDDDLKHIHVIYERIKILTEAGRTYADVELPYIKNNVSVQKISGRTIQPDGTVQEAKGKPFDKIIVKDRSIKIREKVFSLPNAQVGSILDIRYILQYDRGFWPPEWKIQEDLFQKKATFKFIPYLGDWSNNRGESGQGIAWTPYLPPDQHQPELHRSPNGDTVDLALENIPALVEEPYMPPKSILRWRVYFYYRTSEKPENYWKDEGSRWNKEVESFLDHKDGINETLAQITSANDAPELKLRKIYGYISTLENRSFIPERTVQETHTLGFTINNNASDVSKQRSGTHDDLNRLFVAMARSAGFPAWLMRVTDRGEYIFEPRYLSTDQFDGEIAIVQVNGKDLFFDPGTRFCPYGMLPWHYSEVNGLRQSATKGTEVGTAASPNYKQSMIQRKALLTLQDDGTEQGTVMVGFFGLEAMDRRQQGAQTDAVGKKKLLEDEVKGWLPGGSEVSLTHDPRWDDTESPLIAQFKVSGPFATSAGKRRMVPAHVFEINDPPMFTAAERNHPIYFYDPSIRQDEVHITLPEGASVEDLPKDETIKLEYAFYQTTHKMEKPTTILTMRTVIMGAFAFPKDDYKEIKGFYDQVSTGDGQQVLLKAAGHAEGN